MLPIIGTTLTKGLRHVGSDVFPSLLQPGSSAGCLNAVICRPMGRCGPCPSSTSLDHRLVGETEDIVEIERRVFRIAAHAQPTSTVTVPRLR